MTVDTVDERTLQLQHCMYQYSRAIYRSIKDLVDPYVDEQTQLEFRRDVLEACQQTMERIAADPLYFAKPERALFQDIRRYFPITAQAEVAWAVQEGVNAAVALSIMEGEAPVLVPVLGDLLHSELPHVRTMAVSALGNLGAPAANIIPAIERLTQSESDPTAKAAAVEALRQLRSIQ